MPPDDLVAIVRAAAHARLRRIAPRPDGSPATSPKLSADAMLPPISRFTTHATDRLVAIGTSTGGTQALEEVLCALPSEAPGIVIVQHMPEKFTAAFAARLDQLCPSA